MEKTTSNALWHRRAEAFARLDALPRRAIRGLPYARVAGMAMTTEVLVRAWVEERGHTDLIRINTTQRDAVFARLDALPVEQLRAASLHQLSRWGRTSILSVRAWIKVRGLDKIVGVISNRRNHRRNKRNNL